jgi:hypothetical protein
MHQWNVVGIELNDESDPETKALGSIELGDEDHFDDGKIYDALVDAELLDHSTDIEDLIFDGDDNVVFITENGTPKFSITRDQRW